MVKKKIIQTVKVSQGQSQGKKTQASDRFTASQPHALMKYNQHWH